MFPSFQVLNIEIGFQSLQTDFGYQGLIKSIAQLQVTYTEETAVFYIILRIFKVNGMTGIQDRLCIGCTFAVPTVQTLLHIVELRPIVIVPSTVNLITALSHHVNTQFPTFIGNT